MKAEGAKVGDAARLVGFNGVADDDEIRERRRPRRPRPRCRRRVRRRRGQWRGCPAGRRTSRGKPAGRPTPRGCRRRPGRRPDPAPLDILEAVGRRAHREVRWRHWRWHWAIGCSDPCSERTRERTTSSADSPCAATTSRTVMTRQWSRCRSCRGRSCRRAGSTRGLRDPLMRIPCFAPWPVPTIRAIGVASPRAHGQAMMRTATAAVKAAPGPAPRSSQKASVPRARRMTAGTNTRRSGRRAAGRRPARLRVLDHPRHRASCVSVPTVSPGRRAARRR